MIPLHHHLRDSPVPIPPPGFLSTGDGWSRGNWGLLDQRMALLWVRRHASAFGGHKDKILLVGNSAGAASVILHLVSPLSQGRSRKVSWDGAKGRGSWVGNRSRKVMGGGGE